ncbi:MAG: AAA family ATPase [Candidatus Bathyarchaeota archaeon]
MAPVFKMPTVPPEGLSADRDATKRDERLMSLLRERGTLRLLGAVASPALAEAIAGLHATHPNFSAAIDFVLGEEILARQQGGALCGLRLLVHGAAGVGKTDFALSLSKLLGVPSEVLSLSSAQASATLAGSEQYWGNTQPGLVWKALVQGTHANPLFILDEVDKVTDRWGDPLGALYQLLEPRSAAIFADKSVPWLPVDASRAHWIATANDPSTLHPAIRSRFVEVEITPPSADCLAGIVQRLYAELLAEFGLAGRFPEALPATHLQALSGRSIRDTKRLLRTALAQALREGDPQLALAPMATSAPPSQRIGFV